MNFSQNFVKNNASNWPKIIKKINQLLNAIKIVLKKHLFYHSIEENVTKKQNKTEN